MVTVTRARDPVMAREEDQPRLKQLEDIYHQAQPVTLRLVGPNGEEVDLPTPVQDVLRDVIHYLQRGEAVSIIPVHKELTTQQAADLLNVSRQFLVRLLDRGDIPYHRVGTHRRVKFGDLMHYKEQRDRTRRDGLDEISRLGRELGLPE